MSFNDDEQNVPSSNSGVLVTSTHVGSFSRFMSDYSTAAAAADDD
uniref:Uncharacterized protein n=1 Tax=Arundo donax TaxID=35708 RepID=A0A0A9G710_ARUDO